MPQSSTPPSLRESLPEAFFAGMSAAPHPHIGPSAPPPESPRRGLSLAIKLPAAIGVLILIIFGIDTIADYRTQMDTEVTMASNRLDEVAGQYVDMYSRTLSELEETVQRTAQSPAIHRALQNSPPAIGRNHDALDALRAADANGRTLAVELWNSTGTMLLSTDTVSHERDSARANVLMQQAVAAQAAVAGRFQPTREAPTYPVIAPVLDGTRPLGFVVLWRGMDRSAASRQQTSRLIGNGGRIYIGNEDDSVWTDFATMVRRPIRAVAGSTSAEVRVTRAPSRTGEVLAVSRRVPATPWSVVVAFPMSSVAAPVRAGLGESLLVDGLMLIVGVGGAWLVSARLTARLGRLTAAAESFAVPGALPTAFDASAGDEITRLAAALDGMATRVSDALEAQAISEAQYRALFESVPLPLFVADLHTHRFYAVNNAMLDRYGYTREEFGRLAIEDLRPTHERSRMAADIRGLPDRPTHRGQRTHRLKSGALIEVEIVAHRCLFDGHPAVLTLLNDVTDRNQAIAALARSEGRNRALIREAPYGIATSTLDGTLIEVNPALVRMLGHETAATLVGTPTLDLTAEPSQKSAILGELHTTGQAHRDAVILKRRDGHLLTARFNARLVPARSGADGYIEAFIEDITERQRLERQFHEAQRMEAIGQLAGGIAHDFNNLLTVILNTIELMLNDAEESGVHTRELRDVYHSAKRGAHLTRQLLAFSRRQVLSIQPVGVNQLVSDLEGLLHRLLGDDIRLRVTRTSAPDTVRADPTQLEQVIFNLAVNARDAMPGGGELFIEVDHRTVHPGDRTPNDLMKPGDYVVIAVTDTGEGMTAEVREHAFEPFFTTKGREKGTGLGLASVYGIVKQLGGFVWVYSELNRGTTIRIYLPQIDVPATQATAPAPATPAPAPHAAEPARTGSTAGRGTETILIAEDEDAIRKLLDRILAGRGYTVLAESSGEAALARAREHAGPIHLLVTDVVMAGISGPELARQLATSHPETVPLFLSGYTDEAVLRFGVAAGEVAFLQKPFTHHAFLTAVRDNLDQRTRKASV